MRIPVGNFGFRAPDPVQHSQVGSDGIDAAARAGMGLAAQGMHAAGVMIDENQREAQALARAKAGNAMLDREADIHNLRSDIEQRLESGQLSHENAGDAYSAALQLLDPPNMDGLDPAMKETFSKGVKRLELQGMWHVQTAANKARHAELRSQVDAGLDSLGKLSSLPGADMEEVMKRAESLDEIGRAAYGGAWEKKRQDWKDANWDAHLNQKAMAVRNDLSGIQSLQDQITAGEYADKLDSNRRNTLVGKLDAYRTSIIQRADAAANRAAREEERRLKHSEAIYNTFTSMADKGTIIDPTYADSVVTATAGTPYQAGVISMLKQAQETGGIASQPLAVQQSMLDQVDKQIATQGRTPGLDKRREQIEKVMRGSQSDLRDDGLRAGLSRGVITNIAPVDLSSPESVAKTVSDRIRQAETVGVWAGKAVSPFDAREADSMRNMLSALPAKQRSEAIATISQAVGPKLSSAIAEQLDDKDRALSLAFSTSGAQTTKDRYTSELILKGATAIKDGTAMKDDKKVTGWKAQIATEIEGAFPNEKAATAVKDASYFIAAGLAQENGGSVSTSDIKRAVRMAVGGSIIERNGKKLPIPAGIEESDFEKRLSSISASDIGKQTPDGKVRVGGVEMPVDKFAPTIAGQELMFAGQGRYAVIVKGRPVTNSAGRPIIIGVQ